MFKVIHLETSNNYEVKEVKSLSAAKKLIKIQSGEDWETALVNDGIGEWDGIGMIMRDQDKKLKRNALDSVGDIVFIGYQRTQTDDSVLHRFDSLTEEQVRIIRKNFARMMMFRGWSDSELDD